MYTRCLRYLPLLLLFGCADGTDSPEGSTAGISETATVEEVTTDDLTVNLQTTNNAIESNDNDLTALPLRTAESTITMWIDQLQDRPGAEVVVENLRELKTELGGAQIDGDRVSELLSTLATETRKLSGGSADLNTLTSALEAGARKLSTSAAQ